MLAISAQWPLRRDSEQLEPLRCGVAFNCRSQLEERAMKLQRKSRLFIVSALTLSRLWRSLSRDSEVQKAASAKKDVMHPASIPYGSQQLPVEDGDGFVLPWMEQLALQSEDLNIEHKAVLGRLNDLLRALCCGEPAGIAMACSALSAEVRVHFSKEDELMLTTGYPDSATHIKQHDELMHRLARIEYAVKYANDFWTNSDELLMLERWFVPHLTYADRRLADFIAAQRAKSNAA